MNRFFVSKSDFEGGQVVFGSEQAHQIRNVLRMSVSDRIIVLDNTGFEYEVVLTDIRKEKVLGRVDQKRPAPGEPNVHLTLYQSMLKRDKFELVLQKCTELGVTRFVPVITQRSLVRDIDTVSPNKLTRWRRIITEAAEQSHRGRIPELCEPVQFEQAASALDTYDRSLIASPHEQARTLQKALHAVAKNKPQTVALLIGPEGGFTDEEIQLAEKNNAIRITLGPRILRTETAAIVTSALILYELGPMEDMIEEMP